MAIDASLRSSPRFRTRARRLATTIVKVLVRVARPTPPDIAGGGLPYGANAFDDYPGITKLNPDLLDALREATVAAAAAGLALRVNSGWRSREFQDHLLHEARSRYGSYDEASRWVATAATSQHVAGQAVDIGPIKAASWLAAHGNSFGLCRVYSNEPWHFELRDNIPRDLLPPPYPDPSRDPRIVGSSSVTA